MADDGRALLRGIVRAQRRRVIVSSLGGASHQACEALVPVLIGVIVDRAIEPFDTAGLLDPEVNMTYAVKYLAGAYKVAGGGESGAVSNYARGYYYQAKRQGMSPYEAPGSTPVAAQASARRVAAGRAGASSDAIARMTADRHAVF